jgi:serine protease Do
VRIGLVVSLVLCAAAAGCQRGAPARGTGKAGNMGEQGEESAPAAAPPAPSLAPGSAVTPRTDAPSEARVLSAAFSATARALRPSVVRIDVEIEQPRVADRGGDPGQGQGDDEMAPFWRRFFQFGPGMPEQTPGPQRGTGSGVIVDDRGNIVTNRHVVSGATRLKVTFNDGREFTAKTVGGDAETDVAVVRLEKPPGDLVAARLGDSDKLDVGEWVLAVGSPLGLDQTVTAGIVSGLGKVGRHVQMSGGRVRQYIQTDAKINPGNSGGPLCNLSAEVVGINTLINTGPGGAYGFAIPINQVRMVATSLLKDGRVRYAYLGVLVGDIQGLDPGKKAQLGGVDHGAYVSQVTPGGPAGKAGVQPGDVITNIDGRKVESSRDVIDYVSTRAIGSRVSLAVVRGGKPQNVVVELGELPSAEARAGTPSGRLGMALQTLTPELAQSMGLERGARGAVVSDVTAGSAAAAAGVQEGDIILEIDRRPITSAEEATAALAAPRSGGHLVRIRGPAGSRFLTLP